MTNAVVIHMKAYSMTRKRLSSPTFASQPILLNQRHLVLAWVEEPAWAHPGAADRYITVWIYAEDRDAGREGEGRRYVRIFPVKTRFRMQDAPVGPLAHLGVVHPSEEYLDSQWACSLHAASGSVLIRGRFSRGRLTKMRTTTSGGGIIVIAILVASCAGLSSLYPCWRQLPDLATALGVTRKAW